MPLRFPKTSPSRGRGVWRADASHAFATASVGTSSPALAFPKGETRHRRKARKKRARSTHISSTRAYVFEREGGICRCCRRRAAESMHELISAGAMGSRMKATNPSNCVAVCGRLVGSMPSCHTYLQRNDISWEGDAEGDLRFTARTPAAQRWLEAA